MIQKLKDIYETIAKPKNISIQEYRNQLTENLKEGEEFKKLIYRHIKYMDIYSKFVQGYNSLIRKNEILGQEKDKIQRYKISKGLPSKLSEYVEKKLHLQQFIRKRSSDVIQPSSLSYFISKQYRSNIIDFKNILQEEGGTQIKQHGSMLYDEDYNSLGDENTTLGKYIRSLNYAKIIKSEKKQGTIFKHENRHHITQMIGNRYDDSYNAIGQYLGEKPKKKPKKTLFTEKIAEEMLAFNWQNEKFMLEDIGERNIVWYIESSLLEKTNFQLNDIVYHQYCPETIIEIKYSIDQHVDKSLTQELQEKIKIIESLLYLFGTNQNYITIIGGSTSIQCLKFVNILHSIIPPSQRTNLNQYYKQLTKLPSHQIKTIQEITKQYLKDLKYAEQPLFDQVTNGHIEDDSS